MAFENDDLKDCLILWCVEYFEFDSSISGLSLLSRKKQLYEKKPILYAPAGFDFNCNIYLVLKDQTHLIQNKPQIQESTWQLNQIIDI